MNPARILAAASGLALACAPMPQPEDGNRISLTVTQAEAKRLSADDELGRYFDCLEWIPATGELRECEP